MHKRIPLLLPFALITIFFGTLFGCLQQFLRQSANDPQIGIAQEIAQHLDAGVAPEVLVNNPIDVSKTTRAATTIYKKDGTPLVSTVRIGSQTPQVAQNILAAADNRTYSAVTWQAADNVRLAHITVAAKDYYVATARSLKDVEKRQAYMFQLVAFGWGLSMLTAAAGMLWLSIPERATRSKNKKK